ncbi:precorrin-6A/cobalt-precorrin-6A reductase [Thalassococcus sp. BH17M4-6]|uniref:precorrin-6A/cobalt-precorrin-6A reductase n=1 Tax=Thalassococcus sp. BH17M4-6 TaxID=3413148 RepID=UPI003BF4C228
MMDDRAFPLLIVGGSAEARALARALPGARLHLPVAERVPEAGPPPDSMGRVTPDWLAAQGLRAVIEAAHPCDAGTAHDVAAACRACRVPHLQLVRPAWRAGRGDRWVDVWAARDLARVVPPEARVFATLGRGGMADIRALRGPVFARLLGAPDGAFPLRRGRFVPGQGPFSVADEMRLLRRLRIDWLVLRNAGGPGGWPKLAAARALGLRVAMLRRPVRPGGARVRDVKGALAWLRRIQISGG